MSRAYVDANVLLRYLTQDPPDMAEKARETLAVAGRGELLLILTAVTMAEVVWTLDSFYGHSREQIATSLSAFLGAQGLEVPEREVLISALVLYRDRNVDFADALLAAYALENGPNLVCTFDHDFRRVGGLKILEPGAAAAD